MVQQPRRVMPTEAAGFVVRRMSTRTLAAVERLQSRPTSRLSDVRVCIGQLDFRELRPAPTAGAVNVTAGDYPSITVSSPVKNCRLPLGGKGVTEWPPRQLVVVWPPCRIKRARPLARDAVAADGQPTKSAVIEQRLDTYGSFPNKGKASHARFGWAARSARRRRSCHGLSIRDVQKSRMAWL